MCDCKTTIEAKLLEKFKAKHPDAAGHKVTLEGYGLTLQGKTMRLQPYMPVKFGAGHPTKAGPERWKNQRGTMAFTFCPFCGVKLS